MLYLLVFFPFLFAGFLFRCRRRYSNRLWVEHFGGVCFSKVAMQMTFLCVYSAIVFRWLVHYVGIRLIIVRCCSAFAGFTGQVGSNNSCCCPDSGWCNVRVCLSAVSTHIYIILTTSTRSLIGWWLMLLHPLISRIIVSFHISVT